MICSKVVCGGEILFERSGIFCHPIGVNYITLVYKKKLRILG